MNRSFHFFETDFFVDFYAGDICQFRITGQLFITRLQSKFFRRLDQGFSNASGPIFGINIPAFQVRDWRFSGALDMV